MKKLMKISLYGLFLGVALLTQGCSDDLKTAFWWMPSPYAPVQFFTVDTQSAGGGGAVVGGGN